MSQCSSGSRHRWLQPNSRNVAVLVSDLGELKSRVKGCPGIQQRAPCDSLRITDVFACGHAPHVQHMYVIRMGKVLARRSCKMTLKRWRTNVSQRVGLLRGCERKQRMSIRKEWISILWFFVFTVNIYSLFSQWMSMFSLFWKQKIALLLWVSAHVRCGREVSGGGPGFQHLCEKFPRKPPAFYSWSRWFWEQVVHEAGRWVLNIIAS